MGDKKIKRKLVSSATHKHYLLQIVLLLHWNEQVGGNIVTERYHLCSPWTLRFNITVGCWFMLPNTGTRLLAAEPAREKSIFLIAYYRSYVVVSCVVVCFYVM